MKSKYDLDTNIAELVYLFNLIGFKTVYSCQGHTDIQKPYIMFDVKNDSDINKFISAIYDTYNQNKNNLSYVDIGEFTKLFTPYIEVSLDTYNTSLMFNNHYLWKGTYWIVDDYSEKVSRFVVLIKQAYKL